MDSKYIFKNNNCTIDMKLGDMYSYNPFQMEQTQALTGLVQKNVKNASIDDRHCPCYYTNADIKFQMN